MSERLSRALVKVLRHDGAAMRRLHMTRDGYVDVEDLLDELSFSGYSVDDVQSVVQNDRKGRFATRKHHGQLQIKATQGHTVEIPELSLQLIQHHTEARSVLHATNSSAWNRIKNEGLSRMKRSHIHFAPGESAKSGFPAKTDTVIEIDLRKALQVLVSLAATLGIPVGLIAREPFTGNEDGIAFYKSENDVILSKGNTDGIILPKYFKRAYDRRTSV